MRCRAVLHDVAVALATTQLVLNQYQTFYAQLIGNYMTILCAKKLSICKHIVEVRVFQTQCRTEIHYHVKLPQNLAYLVL